MISIYSFPLLVFYWGCVGFIKLIFAANGGQQSQSTGKKPVSIIFYLLWIYLKILSLI